jgi:hypothetical protein
VSDTLSGQWLSIFLALVKDKKGTSFPMISIGNPEYYIRLYADVVKLYLEK